MGYPPKLTRSYVRDAARAPAPVTTVGHGCLTQRVTVILSWRPRGPGGPYIIIESKLTGARPSQLDRQRLLARPAGGGPDRSDGVGCSLFRVAPCASHRDGGFPAGLHRDWQRTRKDRNGSSGLQG